MDCGAVFVKFASRLSHGVPVAEAGLHRRVPDTLREQIQAAIGTTYTIERERGGAGMSRVFVAFDTHVHSFLRHHGDGGQA